MHAPHFQPVPEKVLQRALKLRCEGLGWDGIATVLERSGCRDGKGRCYRAQDLRKQCEKHWIELQERAAPYNPDLGRQMTHLCSSECAFGHAWKVRLMKLVRDVVHEILYGTDNYYAGTRRPHRAEKSTGNRERGSQ